MTFWILASTKLITWGGCILEWGEVINVPSKTHAQLRTIARVVGRRAPLEPRLRSEVHILQAFTEAGVRHQKASVSRCVWPWLLLTGESFTEYWTACWGATVELCTALLALEPYGFYLKKKQNHSIVAQFARF